MPAIRRTLKNVVKNYSDAQVKVREATSNDPWGPSSTMMSEIADLTYNVMAFTEIMQMIWKRLNDDGKNWRHVYKSLVVLDYIIKTGSEKVAQQCKESFHAIKTLTSFQYIDADNKDQGINVREKAKQLVALLSDDERLKNERAKAIKAKERFAQNAMGTGNGPSTRQRMRLAGSPTLAGGGYSEPYGYPESSPSSGSAGTPSEIESARPSSAGEEELQLQLALAMSKEEHEEKVRQEKSDDIKLQMAIEQSKEEAKNDTQPGTLLNLAGPSGNSLGHSSSTDPWGLPPQQPPTDPWGAPLPTQPDPWGSSGAAGGGARPPAYSPVQGTSASVVQSPPQPHDPWGAPMAASKSPQQNSQAGAWSSNSPTPQASAWGATSVPPYPPAPHSELDAFGVPPLTQPATNGTSSNPIDSEFDMLSSRSKETSPTNQGQGLQEFDLLAGGSTTNGQSDAWNMGDLNDSLQDNKVKTAEDFLGANANLVNLDQLVSKAPPKGANPFAMTGNNTNPFQDPNTGARVPMAQMQQPSQQQGFSQPTNAGLLPQPLMPMGNQPLPAQSQQNYNPFL